MSYVYSLRRGFSLVVGLCFVCVVSLAGETTMSLREAKRVLREVPPPSSPGLRGCATRLLPLETLARQWIRLGEALRVWKAAHPDRSAEVDLPVATEHLQHLATLFRFRTSTTSDELNSSQAVFLLGLVDAVEWNRRAWAMPLPDLRREIAALKEALEVYVQRRGTDPRDRKLWAAGDRIHQAGRILAARESWNLLRRRQLWLETTTPPRAPQPKVPYVEPLDED